MGDLLENLACVVGEEVRFAKTVGESDVYLFAGITGDFAPNHVNEQYMKGSRYGHRIAHGALLIGYMSTTSTMMADRLGRGVTSHTPVSLGYDRIRFLAPVFIGDTVEIRYRIAEADIERLRTRSDVEVRNQDGVIVAVGQHILKWVSAGTD